MSYAIKELQALGKNELIRLIVDVCEENQIDWISYGSLSRKKQAALAEIASEVLHAAGELDDPETVEERYEALEADPVDDDLLGKEEGWEYLEPNKPGWMKGNAMDDPLDVMAFEDVETNGAADLEEFEDVEEIIAAVAPAKPKKEKKAKEPKAPKAPKEPKVKGERKRTFSAEQIMEMISLVEESKWTKSKVAEKFECSGTFIHNVIVGNVYRDVTNRGAKAEKAE
jgi:hypothetical protein